MLALHPRFLWLTFFALSSLLLEVAEAFFMPSFSSSGYTKKSEPSAGIKSWPLAPSAALYYGQPYSLDQSSGGQPSMPLAVPVPVAVHAAAPPPPQPPVAPAPPPQFTSFATGGLFHTMQLVPCLCSVPKEPAEPLQDQRESLNSGGSGSGPARA